MAAKRNIDSSLDVETINKRPRTFPDGVRLRPDQLDTIIVHSPCTDGNACIAVMKYYGFKGNFISIGHKNIEKTIARFSPLIHERRVGMFDICTPFLISYLKEHAADFLIIDHHSDTSEHATLVQPHQIIFDASTGACMLVWEYCFPGRPPLPLLPYIAERDVGNTSRPDCIEIMMGLLIFTNRYRNWLEKMEQLTYLLGRRGEGVEEMYQLGKPSIKAYREIALPVVREPNTRFFRLAPEIPVLIVNAPAIMHDVLLDETKAHPYVAIVNYSAAKAAWSVKIRGRRGDTADFRPVAKAYGGGGHALAVSFHYSGHIEDLLVPLPVKDTN